MVLLHGILKALRVTAPSARALSALAEESWGREVGRGVARAETLDPEPLFREKWGGACALCPLRPAGGRDENGRGTSGEEPSVLKGLLAGGITLGVAAVFPEGLVFPFLAVVLGLVSGVFPGLAMADPVGGRSRLHWVLALLLVALGMAGVWTSPVLLAGAFLLHGLWGFLHKFTALGDGIPEGYPAFCVSFDLVLAGFVLYMWSAGA